MSNQIKLNEIQIVALSKVLDYLHESEFNNYIEYSENNDNKNHVYYYAMQLMNLFNVNQD